MQLFDGLEELLIVVGDWYSRDKSYPKGEPFFLDFTREEIMVHYNYELHSNVEEHDSTPNFKTLADVSGGF